MMNAESGIIHRSSFRVHHFRAGVAQLVEHQPSKLRVASSNLVARSSYFFRFWHSCPRSSGVERLLGKEEVMSSNLIAGSINSGSRFEVDDPLYIEANQNV
jgi:hypothetical protein